MNNGILFTKIMQILKNNNCELGENTNLETGMLDIKGKNEDCMNCASELETTLFQFDVDREGQKIN